MKNKNGEEYKILFLPNWYVEKCNTRPIKKQPPDYFVNEEGYWFFKHFNHQPNIKIISTSKSEKVDYFERHKLHFHLLQGIKAITQLNKYDIVISHGMPSAVIVALWRKFFKTKCLHIVFDVGCMNSASESGTAMKLLQYISKSLDMVIYHTKIQGKYYEKYYPWLKDKSYFVRFGADLDFFDKNQLKVNEDKDKYIVCIGASKRDWKTLVLAYQKIDTDIKLRIIGNISKEFDHIKGIEQLGHITIDELIDQINNSLFCVLPLVKYNYSYGQMTLLQQMALEKCVIVSNVPSFEDYIIDEESCYFYESGNIDELSEIMRLLINNNEMVQFIGKKARNYLVNNLNECTMALEVESLILKMMEKKHEN